MLHYQKHNLLIKKILACSLLVFFNTSFALEIIIPKILKPNLSISILDADTADSIYSYNSNTYRLVASNVKLFTTLFGLTYLHPDFHWHTQLKYTGNIKEHTLYGNLYLQGGGDPTLDNSSIYDIISSLKDLNINRIYGNVILDNSLFNDKPTYSMLQTDIYDADKIPPSGLIIDGNRTNLTIHVNENNVSISHNLYNVKVINHLKLDPTAAKCNIDDTIGISSKNNVITIDGNVSPSCDKATVSYFTLSNFNYNRMVVTHVFNNFNIKIQGNFKNEHTPSTAKLIHDHSSQSLVHVIYDMNQFSNNLYAETIIATVGAYKTPNEQTFADGAKLYYRFLQDNSLLNPKFKLENGAGLSRYEYFTASEVAHLLYLANNSPLLGAYLEASLPVATQEGSLQNKFSDFAGRFMAKTGTLNDTRAYSGYFYSKTGEKYIVVFIANNLQNSEQKDLVQKFIKQVLTSLNK